MRVFHTRVRAHDCRQVILGGRDIAEDRRNAVTREVAGYPRFTPGAAVREMGAAQDALAWALPLISEAAAHKVRRPGDWSIAMNLAHLVVYEERIAVPVLAALADGADSHGVTSGDEDWLERDTEKLGGDSYAAVRDRYRSIARRHLDQLQAFDEETFNAPRCSLWASDNGVLVPAGWVAKKSVQHTWEHGHTLIRAGWIAYAIDRDSGEAR
jgi:DinB family protein